MIAILLLSLFMLVVVLSAVFAFVQIVAIRRTRQLYRERLAGLHRTMRDLEYAAISSNEVVVHRSTLWLKRYPTPRQYRKLKPTEQLLYASDLRSRVRLAGLWKHTVVTIATVVLSIVAVQMWNRFGRLAGTVEDPTLSEAAGASAKDFLLIMVFGVLALVPAIATLLSRSRRRTAEQLLDQYSALQGYRGAKSRAASRRGHRSGVTTSRKLSTVRTRAPALRRPRDRGPAAP